MPTVGWTGDALKPNDKNPVPRNPNATRNLSKISRLKVKSEPCLEIKSVQDATK